MNNLTALLNRLGLARIAAMGVVTLLLLGFFAFLVMRVSSPQLAPLYSGLSFEDSAAIVSDLQRQNVPFELRGDGDTILVARDQITTLRMQLAENGLPTRGQVGYEIFDQQSALGTTSFMENINNVRALEGELARTITSLARIRTARVHLVLPARELFTRDKQDPTASIVLAVRGELSTGEIRAIQHLVASAVEGLTPARVSIVDDSGQLLASGAGNDADSAMADEVEERALGIESRLRTRVEDLLTNVIGAGKARVQVSVDLDTQRSTKTTDTFDPDGQVVRSTQTRDLSNSSTDGAAPNGVTVANALPGADQQNGSSSTTSEQGSTTEETTNYEISKTSETTVNEAGSIKRLSVAVVVDGTYADDGKGASVYQPRSADEITQIKSLVQSAAGFDATRGDQIEVVNMQFAARADLTAQGTSDPGLFNFTRDDLMQGAELLVTLLISLALLFFVLRPLLRRVLSPEQAGTLNLPPSAEGGHAPGAAGFPAPGTAGFPGPDGMMVQTSLPGMQAAAPGMQMTMAGQPMAQALARGPAGAVPGNPAQPAAWLGAAKSLGETQGETLKTVGTLVDDNPKQAAMIVRDWLSSAA